MRLRVPLIWRGRVLTAAAIFSAWVGAAAAQPVAFDVAGADLGFDKRSGVPIVLFRLTEPSSLRFADLTARNVGKPLAIRVDGRVLSKPVVRQPILGGSGQISGGLSVEEARDIANRLASGAAKLEFEVEN
jgi:preprotein translocase subunit SecD